MTIAEQVEESYRKAIVNDPHRTDSGDPREADCAARRHHVFISQMIDDKNRYFCRDCKKNLLWK
jgi:hypothetical protein